MDVVLPQLESGSTMTDRDSLLAAIIADPGDDLPRRSYVPCRPPAALPSASNAGTLTMTTCKRIVIGIHSA